MLFFFSNIYYIKTFYFIYLKYAIFGGSPSNRKYVMFLGSMRTFSRLTLVQTWRCVLRFILHAKCLNFDEERNILTMNSLWIPCGKKVLWEKSWGTSVWLERDRLYLWRPLEGINYFIFLFLRSGVEANRGLNSPTEHTIFPALGRKWGAECFNTAPSAYPTTCMKLK